MLSSPAALKDLMPVGGRPGGLGKGTTCPLCCNMAEFAITCTSETDMPFFATLTCDRAGAGQRLYATGCRETLSVITEMDQESWGKKASCTRQ